MKISYNKLWKLLIDKQMKKSDLRKKAGISSSSLTKLTKDENVTTETISKICQELKYYVADIIEYVPDSSPRILYRISEGEKGPSDRNQRMTRKLYAKDRCEI